MIPHKLIYTDKSGNKLYESKESHLVIFNSLGKMVRPTEIKPIVKQPLVKKAMKEFYLKPKFKKGGFK